MAEQQNQQPSQLNQQAALDMQSRFSSKFNESRKSILTEMKGISTLVSNVSLIGDFVVVQFKTLPAYRVGDLKQHFCTVLDEQLNSNFVFFKQEDNTWMFRRSEGHE